MATMPSRVLFQALKYQQSRKADMNNHALKMNERKEGRRHKRVKVVLKGALRIPGQGVEMIRTLNISESGVALTTVGVCAVENGKEVQLHLEGIVNNQDTEHLETYKMFVVHNENNAIGLKFS